MKLTWTSRDRSAHKLFIAIIDHLRFHKRLVEQLKVRTIIHVYWRKNKHMQSLVERIFRILRGINSSFGVDQIFNRQSHEPNFCWKFLKFWFSKSHWSIEWPSLSPDSISLAIFGEAFEITKFFNSSSKFFEFLSISNNFQIRFRIKSIFTNFSLENQWNSVNAEIIVVAYFPITLPQINMINHSKYLFLNRSTNVIS